jgi:hypothetical protein
MVTFTVVTLSGSIGMPAFLNYLQRAKLEGAARETVMLLHATRLEAITRGAPTVVALDESTGELVAFADVDGEGSQDLPDGIFNPVSGDRDRETDYELRRYRLPNGLRFADPDGDVGLDSIEGFANPAPLPDRMVYYRIDGTVAGNGALRVADTRGNFLEARIAAVTTARVELRKWDGSTWREQGEEGAWRWQ